MMTLSDVVAIGIGGFAGAIIRYLVSKQLNTNSYIPYGTFLVNMIGCLLIGFVAGLELSRTLTFLLGSGLAGALTTFSTWLKEIVGMARSRELVKSSTYLMGAIIFGITLVYVGFVGAALFQR